MRNPNDTAYFLICAGAAATPLLVLYLLCHMQPPAYGRCR